jgi:hypothetical protein
MTREARMMSGIILITVPAIQYGGYFLLTSLMNKGSGYMENPLRQNFFSRRARPRGRDRDSFAGLPDARGWRSASRPSSLVRSNRSAARGDSHFVGVLLLGAATGRHSRQRSRRPDLRRGSGFHPRGDHARRRVVAVASTELGLQQKWGFDQFGRREVDCATSIRVKHSANAGRHL